MNIISGKKFKIWESAALAALCICLCAGTWAQGRHSSISGKLVRLHVIAASDEKEEQEIKLEVRDAVLSCLKPKLSRAKSPGEAEKLIRENLELVAREAGKAARGRSVRVTVCREQYPTRCYEGFTLPAGSYESLKITLGEGRGHNWWCIVFPPLCLSAAQAETVKEAMGQEDYSIICSDEGFRLRFKIVEIWGEILNNLAKK